MGSLRAENHKQNLEIASLKETVQLQNKTISQHESKIQELITVDQQQYLVAKDVLDSFHPLSCVARKKMKMIKRILTYSTVHQPTALTLLDWATL